MKLTLNQAARESGRAKSTISKAIKSGKLSAERLEGGSYHIEPAELFRVFPVTGHEHDPLPDGNPEKNSGNTPLQAELDALRGQLASASLEREREREQLTDQIEDLRRRLDAESDERRKLTALLTSQQPQPLAPVRRGFFGFLRRAG